MRRSFVALAPVFAAPVIAVTVASPLIAAAGGSSPVAGPKPTITTSTHGSTGTLTYAKPDSGRRWN